MPKSKQKAFASSLPAKEKEKIFLKTQSESNRLAFLLGFFKQSAL